MKISDKKNVSDFTNDLFSPVLTNTILVIFRANRSDHGLGKGMERNRRKEKVGGTPKLWGFD